MRFLWHSNFEYFNENLHFWNGRRHDVTCSRQKCYVTCGQNMRIYYECEGGIEKSVPMVTNWHHEACQVMTIGDREELIFLSPPHTNNGLFFLLTTIKTSFYIGKHGKEFQKILNRLRCDIYVIW